MFKLKVRLAALLVLGTSAILVFAFGVASLAQADNWTLQGSNIYNNNSGNVGVASSTPGSTLVVQGTSTAPAIPLVTIASSSGASYLQVTSAGNVNIANGALSGASGSSNFLQVSGTLNPTNSNSAQGILFTITSAGSSNQLQAAIKGTLSAGYTGANSTFGINVSNSTAGTGTSGLMGSFANYAAYNNSNSTTAGNNVGALGTAQGSSSANLGVVGRSFSGSNSALLNVGVMGISLNATTSVGGFFALENAIPTFATSSALVVDNASSTGSDLFVAQSKGTALDVITGSGNIGINTTTPSQALSVVGNVQLSGNIVSNGDICIGTCP